MIKDKAKKKKISFKTGALAFRTKASAKDLKKTRSGLPQNTAANAPKAQKKVTQDFGAGARRSRKSEGKRTDAYVRSGLPQNTAANAPKAQKKVTQDFGAGARRSRKSEGKRTDAYERSGLPQNTAADVPKDKERVAKRMAAAGLCSRRDAEKWIADGRVWVNGEKLLTPACVVGKDDEIVVDGVALKEKETPRMWCYHKPVGLLTTHKDPQGRPTVFENLPKSLPRVISVGRLDLNSEGLLLLTTDGELARSIELPSRGWKRQYRVRIHGQITPEMIKKAAQGLTIEGIHYAPCVIEVEENQSGGKNQWVKVTLTEGKNREIRRLMENFGLQVARLIRISYGPFQLGSLPVGEVREIPYKVIKEQL